MASDEVTIDVGPVWCPSCKREYGNTERDAEVSVLRAALEGLAARFDGQEALAGSPLVAARDALARYPSPAADTPEVSP